MGSNISGLQPLSYMGVEAKSPPTLIKKAQAPNANNNEFRIGTIWINTVNDSVYILTNLVGGVATWTAFEATPIDFATDSGTATESSSEINILGTNNLATSGTGSTVTVTLTNGSNGEVLIGGGSAPAWANIASSGGTVAVTNTANGINLEATGVAGLVELDGDSGAALPVAGVIVIAGGTNITTAGATDTVTVNLDASPSVAGSLTAGTSVSAGTSMDSGTTITAGSTLTSTTTMTCGTGLTVSAGGIDSTGTTTLQDLGTGVVLSSAAGVISNSAGNNGQLLIGATGTDPAWASVTSSGSTITITEGANTLNLEAVSGGLLPWASSATDPLQMAVNNGYIVSSGTDVVRILPVTASVGDIVRVGVTGSGISVKITQNAGQFVFGRGTNGIFKDSTAGVTGYVTFGASIELLCVVANTTWQMISYSGATPVFT